ncbi:hypothetical protein NCU02320 [Neurospora crassa OR74A]|uniref:Uncharacterized protein n=1 Tax=Neurospora crassa (strain ATCC 24698 / 74-OR23-1A / CBS 708.71 / DSM 1257 / FGSC 987) TaxID=367110 RepID=Q7S415_NEUCR|nr:hypothetical protein NCU02320 [Neurospora crassa OR74A]EAA30247.3 hypothetical protein NCU02320 [Neurospora crassa OR74A]|eukprot:XP_959483.3 hypothetical protein NCU02320 [Neurospora crassa OR74A]
MAGPTPTNTISGADSHATPMSAITSSHISSSRYQTRPQAQTPAQTTTAFIFHVSTLVYRPRSAGSPPHVGTNRANSNSDAIWSPISSVCDSNSSSISGYTSYDSHSSSTWNQNININININPTNSQPQSRHHHHHHPDPLRQHQVKLLRPLLPRPSAGETVAGLQAVGIPFVIVWEPTEPSESGAALGHGLKCGYEDDDRLDDEFTSEEEVANTITKVLGLEVPIGSERVVGRWTLLRSVAAVQGRQSQKGGKDGKDGKEVAGTLVIGDDEEKNREMARMLGFQAESVVNSEEVEMMWKKKKEVAGEEKGNVEGRGEKMVEKREDRKEEQKSHELNPQQNQSQRQHLKPSKPTLTLRSRLSCPFDDMKIVEGLCSSPEDKVDEETTNDNRDGSEKQGGLVEEKGEANEGRPTESPTPTTPLNPDTVQGLYIPVKHGERTVAYVPVSPTSTTCSEKGLESPVTRITSVIFFSPPSLRTWDRDVRVVSKLCQSQGGGEDAPKLYIVQEPGEFGHSSPSLASAYSSSTSSSTSSNIPSPTFSTAPSEASLETLASTASTVFSRASTTSTAESAPSKRQFRLTMPHSASDWIREVTTQWRATSPNLPDKAKLSYYLIDPLTCALQVLEIGRQRAQSTIWARANLPVHLRQVLRLETLYIVDSGEHPSRFFNDLSSASGNKDKHSASSDPDPDMSFQRYLASLGVDAIPAKRCRRIGMSNVHALEKRVQKLGYVCRPICDSFNRLEPLRDEDEDQDQKTKKIHENKDSGDASARQPTAQAHQRRTSWFRQLITRGQPRSKSRNPGASDQSQIQRPSTSTSTNKTRNKYTNHSNNSTTNLTINSTNIPTFPPSSGIPRSMTTPNYPNYPNTTYAPNTNLSTETTATAKFYSPSALDMVSHSPTQKARDMNAITAFCHSNNIETAVQYAINREYWECVDKGLSPVWPTSGGGGGGDGGNRTGRI